METIYKREANRNYLILKIEDTSDYRIRMLTENNPQTFLKAELKEWNGDSYLYYDIGSKQPLSVIYEKNTIGFEDLRTLIFALHDAYDEAFRYLLDGNCICAKPDFCYVRPGTKDYEWLFYPSLEDNGLEDLAEFLIDKVSGFDKKCVETAHNIYKLIKTGNVTTKELVMLVENADELIKEDYGPVMTETIRKEKTGPVFELGEKEKKESFLAQIKAKLRGERQSKEELEVTENWLYEKDLIDTEVRSAGGETRIININDKPERRVLVGTGKKDRGEHELNSFPYIAGKMSEQADLILNSPLCSRMHARFSEEDGHIYIEDLNSTNGTFKNGFRLEVGEKVKLTPGDEIKFADITYVYE